MKIEEQNGFLIVSPNGKLDTITAPKFSEELLTIINPKLKGCIIDLSDISFLSSSGLQSLLIGAKEAQKNNIKYAVCGMNKMVKDVFLLSGFDRFINSFDTLEDTIKNL